MNRTYVPYAERAEHVHYKGDWASGTAYNYGDEVANDGALFVCILAHTSAAGTEPIPDADENMWNWSTQEAPTGTKNGSNKTFTLAHEPVGDIIVHFNGLEYQNAVDYSNSGTALTLITFAPNDAEGDKFWVTYPY